ncbi:MAG: hypothetical protein NZM26_01790 [Patescibacteria group bacterium]|nr:hypothetical protein [Patescibacteria group bacterium]
MGYNSQVLIKRRTMIFPWLALFDFATVRANFIKPIDIKSIKARSNDFAILVPVYNDIKYIKNIDFLKKYAEKVVLCTTNKETEEFYEKLNKLSKEHGFRISISDVTQEGKNPFSIFNKVLLAHDLVLKESLKSLDEKYVIFIDGDTFVNEDLAILCGAMEENDFDIASVKVIPSRRSNLIEHLQGVEYDIAMQARLIYPWLTSGAGMVAKRLVMEEVMKNHSLFFNGGDIEIGKIADIMGFKVGHIPMIFYTEIPETFGKWVKQRFSWMSGAFRHSIINIHHNLNHPFHFIYFSFIIYFLYPIKVYELIKYWYLFPLLVLLYIVITFLANWKVRNKYMILFPFYAFFQVMVIIWFGIWRYFNNLYKTKNVGLIRIRYHSPFARRKRNLPYRIYNYSTSLAVVLLIIAMTQTSPIELVAKSHQSIASESISYFGKLYQELRNDNNEILNPLVSEGSQNPNLQETQTDQTISNQSQEKSSYYLIVTETGDSLYRLSRKAIDLYIQDYQVEITQEEKTYAEDSMKDANIKNFSNVRPGMLVKFEKKEIERHLALAKENLEIK